MTSNEIEEPTQMQVKADSPKSNPMQPPALFTNTKDDSRRMAQQKEVEDAFRDVRAYTSV